MALPDVLHEALEREKRQRGRMPSTPPQFQVSLMSESAALHRIEWRYLSWDEIYGEDNPDRRYVIPNIDPAARCWAIFNAALPDGKLHHSGWKLDRSPDWKPEPPNSLARYPSFATEQEAWDFMGQWYSERGHYLLARGARMVAAGLEIDWGRR